MVNVRPYQTAMIDALLAARDRGLQRVIGMLPTGTGKTITFAQLIQRVLQQRVGGRAIVLAHRDELVRQAAEKIQSTTGIECGIVKAEEDDSDHDVIVASVQTLVRPARIERLFARRPEPFSLVVVDEVHHYLAGDDGNTFGRVLEGLGSMTPGGPFTVGVSATPERADGAALGATWQELVYKKDILSCIREGWLVEPKGKQVKLAADFNDLHTRAGDFRDDETEDMLMAADAPEHAAVAYKTFASDRKGVIFTPTIVVSKAMADKFCAHGIRAEHVDGFTPMTERRAILKRLRTGETQVVSNAAVLTEGWDEPSISCIVMARPTKSRVLAIQCIGRGLRPYFGKQDCLVIDLVGSTLRKDLVTVASLFKVGEKAAERGILSAVAEQEALYAPDTSKPKDGQLVAKDVEMLGRSAFNWVLAGQSLASASFILQLGGGATLVIEPNQDKEDTFDIFRSKTEKVGENSCGRSQYKTEREKLYAAMSLEMAQGTAEDIVRNNKAEWLNRKDAGWRSRPPTEKQIKTLQWKKRYREGMTMGECSDALTAIFGARR